MIQQLPRRAGGLRPGLRIAILEKGPNLRCGPQLPERPDPMPAGYSSALGSMFRHPVGDGATLCSQGRRGTQPDPLIRVPQQTQQLRHWPTDKTLRQQFSGLRNFRTGHAFRPGHSVDCPFAGGPPATSKIQHIHFSVRPEVHIGVGDSSMKKVSIHRLIAAVLPCYLKVPQKTKTGSSDVVGNKKAVPIAVRH